MLSDTEENIVTVGSGSYHTIQSSTVNSSSTPSHPKTTQALISPAYSDRNPMDHFRHLQSPAFTATPSSIHSVRSKVPNLGSLEPSPQSDHQQEHGNTGETPLARLIDFDEDTDSRECEELQSSHEDDKNKQDTGRGPVLSQSLELDKAEQLVEMAISGLRRDILELSGDKDLLGSPLKDALEENGLQRGNDEQSFSNTPQIVKTTKRVRMKEIDDSENEHRKGTHSRNVSFSRLSSNVNQSNANYSLEDQARDVPDEPVFGLDCDSRHLGQGTSGFEENQDIDAPTQFQDQDDFQLFATFTQTPKLLRERMESDDALLGTDEQEKLLTDLETSGLLAPAKTDFEGGLKQSVGTEREADIGSNFTSDAEDNIRVINFQNGSFSEILEKSPTKASEREERDMKLSLKEDRLGITENLEAELEAWRQKGLVSASPRKAEHNGNGSVSSLLRNSQTKPARDTRGTVSLENSLTNTARSDIDVDRLVAGYKLLRLGQTNNTSSQPSGKPQDTATNSHERNQNESNNDSVKQTPAQNPFNLKVNHNKHTFGSPSHQPAESWAALNSPHISLSPLEGLGIEDDDFADIRSGLVGNSPLDEMASSPAEGSFKTPTKNQKGGYASAS